MKEHVSFSFSLHSLGFLSLLKISLLLQKLYLEIWKMNFPLNFLQIFYVCVCVLTVRSLTQTRLGFIIRYGMRWCLACFFPQMETQSDQHHFLNQS